MSLSTCNLKMPKMQPIGSQALKQNHAVLEKHWYEVWPLLGFFKDRFSAWFVSKRFLFFSSKTSLQSSALQVNMNKVKAGREIDGISLSLLGNPLRRPVLVIMF